MMKNKAQSILEYAVLIVVVAAALMAMQVYFKRGLQGKARSSADELSGGLMYSPGATTAASNTTRSITEGAKSYTEKTSLSEKSISESTFELDQQTIRKGSVSSFADEPERNHDE